MIDRRGPAFDALNLCDLRLYLRIADTVLRRGHRTEDVAATRRRIGRRIDVEGAAAGIGDVARDAADGLLILRINIIDAVSGIVDAK